MTHKNLVKLIDGLVAEICSRKGLDPKIGVKGGEAEMAHSLLGMAIKQHAETLLAAAQAPKPAADAPADAADAA